MPTDASPPLPEVLDVLIVGAGLSGIGAAWHLQNRRPEASWAIVESRQALGGTWDLFRYPGIRSDSDMYTFGYRFQPWRGGRPFADGPSILAYLQRTAAEHGIDRRIHFGHRMVAARWSSAAACWQVTLEVGGAERQVRCRWLYACTGYYRYDRGYTPPWPDLDRFGGQVVHPQHWPEGLEVAGRRVVVVGSGATAVTLVPALAERGAEVTLLQRSPTWVAALPSRDRVAEAVEGVLGARTSHRVIRWRNILRSTVYYQLARRQPARFGAVLKRRAAAALGGAVPVEPHFAPDYAPWDQRVCAAPDGDLFEALSSGAARIVTDTIDGFVPEGVRLASGATLGADLLVTATGLEVALLHGVAFEVDGVPVRLGEALTYKGMMLSGVPNFVAAVGYTNASWTLKCDLIAEHACRLMAFMAREGHQVVVPVRPDGAGGRPSLDLQSGYVRRAADQLPKQGDGVPWAVYQNYLLDLWMLRYGAVDDPALAFSGGRSA